MNINKQLDGEKLIIGLDGALDSTSSPILEDELEKLLPNVKFLVFDLEKLNYISSAGLRVFLSTQRIMNEQGEMKVINVNDEVMDVFEITGFPEILTIE